MFPLSFCTNYSDVSLFLIHLEDFLSHPLIYVKEGCSHYFLFILTDLPSSGLICVVMETDAVVANKLLAGSNA